MRDPSIHPSAARTNHICSNRTPCEKQKRFATFKDHLHASKMQNTVYSVACSCGERYIGESVRNLKIRVHEHKQRSSKSAIGLHVCELEDKNLPHGMDPDHSVLKESAIVIAQGKNNRKRKFIESVCIIAKAPRLCNFGPSVEVSEVWNPNLATVARALPSLD